MYFNQLILAGRLTRDPETRYMSNGDPLASFGVAVTRKFGTGANRKEETLFMDCSMFGKRSELFVKYHRKGSACFLVGYLKPVEWADKQTGEVRRKIQFNVEAWEFAGSRNERDGGSSDEAPAPASVAVTGGDEETPF